MSTANLLIVDDEDLVRWSMGPAADTPIAFKTIGAVSLLSWLMVLYWGRMLPFLGNAF